MPDPSTYNASDASTYKVLDGSNYRLVFDHATDADGNAIGEGQYATGCLVYYKIIPTDTSSLTGWVEKKISSPWIIGSSSKISMKSSAIQVTLGDPKPYNQFDLYPALTVTDLSKNKVLVLGTDYTINTVSSTAPSYDASTGEIVGIAVLTGKGNYSSSLSVPYTCTKGILSSSVFADDQTSWCYANPDNTITPFSQTNLVWRNSGWTAEQVNEVIGLSWYANAYLNDRAFVVQSITKNGIVVDKIDEMDAEYMLTVTLDAAQSNWFSSLEGGSVQIPVKMEKQGLSGAYSFSTTGLTLYSKAEMSPDTYMYTGNAITPTLTVYDCDGALIDPSFFTFVYPQGGRGIPLEVGDYNVPSIDATHPNRYDDLRVTGDGVHYERDTSVELDRLQGIQVASSITDLSFSIVAADISDASKVRIEVTEAFYADGAAVEPEITFYDAQTGALLNYTQGEDYTLSYLNNIAVGQATGANPPTVVITPTDNGHLSAGSGAVSFAVPFTIQGSGSDVATVSWDYASTIALNVDGTLSEPGIVGILDGKTVSKDAYAVEVGTYDPVTKAFSAKADDWHAGDTAYYRVIGVKEGVLAGTTVLGPLTVVAASDANTFVVGSQTITASAADTVYTGIAAQPVVTAKAGQAALLEGRDFKVACTSVNAGAATVTLSGIGAYAGSVDVSFTITKADMASLVVKAVSKAYTGSQVMLDEADIESVKLGSVELPASDWAIDAVGFGSNVDVAQGGTAKLVPGTSGNVMGTANVVFAITPAPLLNDEITITVSDVLTYSGTYIQLTPDTLTVQDTARSKGLVFGNDYEVAGYANNINAGTATVYISGKGNYSSTANAISAPFTVHPLTLTEAMVSGVAASYEFAGVSVQPMPTVKVGSTMVPTSDYTVTYGANTEIGFGKGSVTVTPKGGNIVGSSVTKIFDITADISHATVEAIPNHTYSYGGSYEPDLTVTLNGVTLGKGVAYEVAYDNANAGQKTLVVTGKAPYTGTKVVTYSIDGKPLATDMAASISSLTYTGSALTPVLTLVDGSYALQAGVDYAVAYDHNTHATTDTQKAVATVTGKGNYAGVITLPFAIAPKQLSSTDVTATVTASGLFKGTGTVGADIVLKDTSIKDSENNSYILTLGTDYTVSLAGNDKVGTATATITGAGDYAGVLGETYGVIGDVTVATISSVPDQAYAGASVPVEPAIQVALGSTVLSSTDYDVSYTNNIVPGMAAYTITGKGLYAGTRTGYFTIAMPTLTDAATGIVMAGTGLVDAGQGSSVTSEIAMIPADDALFATVRDSYATDDTELFLGYSISLYRDVNGTQVALKDGFGSLTLTLPVGEAYNGRSARVVIRHTDGEGVVTYETRQVTVENGVVTLSVDKLSEFFVTVDRVSAGSATTGAGSAAANSAAGSSDSLAATGDGSLQTTMLAILLLSALSFGTASAVLMFRKKKH